jgi:hypothetical protein
MISEGQDKANYGTAVNCIDGEIQQPTIEYLKKVWLVDWVDVITAPAPELLLSECSDNTGIRLINENIQASMAHQERRRVAVVAHCDCIFNTAPTQVKRGMLQGAVRHLRESLTDAEVVGVWIDGDGTPCTDCDA